MKKAIGFLRMLQENNNREWFTAHKDAYRQVQSEVEAFTEKLINGICTFDSSVHGLSPKDCTYRIYRDTRFSADKTPYKSHIGIYVCPGGKKSTHAGYYFHIEPTRTGVPETGSGGHMISTGLYMPEPAVLRSVREEICFNGEEFLGNVTKAKGFSLGRGNMLKRTPTGFPADSPYAEYLRLKDVYLEMPLSEDFILSPGLLAATVNAFASTYEFNRQLNRAVDFALEGM